MPRPQLIEPSEVLAKLEGWSLVGDRPAIARSFGFADFAAAFAFMTRCALVAERLDHHPEWRNVYDRVDVVLSTHDVGGVTVLDLRLAQAMNDAYANFTSP